MLYEVITGVVAAHGYRDRGHQQRGGEVVCDRRHQERDSTGDPENLAQRETLV